ncbi:hypothetical protein HPB49_018916 [Dermacentor silvarum]|uniref:Uncharacterized protein n=1 Tax=Dermacentor silvarum TaxID=543639 RepID=A0ACB8CZ45_DERSI|nr:hypothetical protein HPB49_018916 [Dermacentor silvarum]
MSEKYDEVLERLAKQDRELVDIKTRLATVENSSSGKDVSDLKDRINDLEQYSRRQNLEIHGLKSEANENLLPKINKLGASLGLRQLVEEDINGVHRLPAKQGRESPILVRFVSRKTKDNWQEKDRQLRESKSDVLFYDNLTPRNKHLLWMAHTRALQMDYHFTWQKNGKVLVRKGPGEPIFRITREADLAKIKGTGSVDSDKRDESL